MTRNLTLTVATSLLALALPAAAQNAKNSQPGAFAQGQKLPGDLSDLLDADGDGQVSDAEAKKAVEQFQQAARNNPNAKEVLDLLDANGDGKVDRNEAAAGVAQGRLQFDGPGVAVNAIFNQLDVNKDKAITPKEFQGLIQKLGPLGQLLAPRLAQMFNQLDVDRNGAVSFVESQLAADYFAEQAQMRKQQQQQQRDGRLYRQAQQIFAAQDKNRNNRISTREAVGPVKEKFSAIDNNGDQKLSLIEVYDFLKQGKNPEPRKGSQPR